jgi:hypothetical protein
MFGSGSRDRGGTAALLLAALVLLAGPGAADAQNIRGIEAGLNFGGMGGDMDQVGDLLAAGLADEVGGDWRADKVRSKGLAVGAYYCLARSPSAALQIEALYVRRGAGFDIKGGGTTLETSFKLDYLEIPLLARLSTGYSGWVRGVFVAGPVVGFKVGSSLQVKIEDTSSSIDSGQAFRSTVFGATFGAGLAIRTGTTSELVCSLRYHAGLTNAFDPDEAESQAGDITLLLGWELSDVR